MENTKLIPNTYLGQKGYTIYKKHLSSEKIDFIKNELTIRPHVHGSPIKGGGDSVGFPAYRESTSKIYVPRYFGEHHFGKPSEIKIPEGTGIDLSFHGKLRENQGIVVDTYLNHVLNLPYGGGGLLDLPCAYGKTTLSLYIIAQLKKKALVLVHKEFLLNQWIERIHQFLPHARVGKIQGPIIDIENKDIVIGMIQSLAMKEYNQEVFESFGLVIIDEVHHISSEVFSRTLFKLVPKYMLGLSATMNRKDGTTKVFKMFLGDIIYKGRREEEHKVIVRGIKYMSTDEDFNKVVTDYRGNPMYSTMIVKLCDYNYRSEFILRVLSDMIKENSEQQIMILAHNKSLLKYLYDAIEHRGIASVGYYIGGMKEAALKVSETKKIIIATYSMAAEALDIKTLTTLIMATPKTDIEQSVGRILRERHSQPVVVDIIDRHDMFQNQWRKRKTFYNKQGYKIIYTTSVDYNTDYESWDQLNASGKKCVKDDSDEEDNKQLQDKCLIKIKKQV